MATLSWRQQRRMDLAAGSEVIETAVGPVEIARSGTEPYVFQLHGTPGGYDQGLSLGNPFVAAGMGSIAVSRPGYLRTPITVGRTAPEQADALAHLLDALQIEKVAVQGVSGGGPSANQFAIRHPDRIHALLLTCAVSAAYPIVIPAWSKLLMTPLGMRMGEWMMGKFPEASIRQTIKEESTYSQEQVEKATAEVMADPQRLSFVRKLTSSSTPWQDRKAGFEADMETILGLAEDPLPLEMVACPTLIVHGDQDDDVPYSVGLEAHERITGSVLYTMEGAHHLLWLSDKLEEMNRAQVAFVARATTSGNDTL